MPRCAHEDDAASHQRRHSNPNGGEQVRITDVRGNKRKNNHLSTADKCDEHPQLDLWRLQRSGGSLPLEDGSCRSIVRWVFDDIVPVKLMVPAKLTTMLRTCNRIGMPRRSDSRRSIRDNSLMMSSCSYPTTVDGIVQSASATTAAFAVLSHLNLDVRNERDLSIRQLKKSLALDR